MRRRDEHDYEAERLFDMVRNEEPDDDVVRAIAESLRKAATHELSKPKRAGKKR